MRVSENRIEVPCPCGKNDMLIGIYLPIWEGIGKLTCPVCKETYFIKVSPEQIGFISEIQYEEEETNGTWCICDEEDDWLAVDKKERHGTERMYKGCN